MNIVLASGSPRRHALLTAAQFQVEVDAVPIDETPRAGELPPALVARLADEKCSVVAQRRHNDIVIAADTEVVLGTRVFGKPTDDADACEMLAALSGQTHEVITAFCVRQGQARAAGAVVTAITFRTLTRAEISQYVAQGESRDKAGAYAIQGAGGALIDTINGSYTNVVGLPVREVKAAIEQMLNLKSTTNN